MPDNRVLRFLLCGGVSREDYDSLRPMLWRWNLNNLRITASLAAGMGAVFLVITSLLRSGSRIPYLLLLCGSSLTLCLLPVARKSKARTELWSILICYGQMILICGYATILSMQPANYDIPATSAIVFLALLPLSIDDRPIRMFSVMLGEAAVYLLFSHMLKSPRAFSLDLMNVLSFCVVGMILYVLVCARNIRELRQSQRIEQMSFQTIRALANAIDAKDPYTKGHSTRVSQYAVLIAKDLGWPAERINDLRCAALLHDIGKIGVPDSILNKPTRLTDVEYDIIKSHTTMGADILRGRTTIDSAENVACSHHERYDGRGYPRGLSGTEISEEARIVGIADAFDAMNSNRVYRKACDRDYIYRQLTEGRGKQFDPAYVDVLIGLWNRGSLEESLQSIPGWKERSESLESSLHEAVESFISESTDTSSLFEDIKSNGRFEGALNVEYSQFTRLYEFIANLEKRFDHSFKLVLITLEESPGEEAGTVSLEKAMFYLERAIRISIRDVDIVTHYNRRQFLLILVGADPNGVKTAVDRIFKSYFRMSGGSEYTPSYSILGMTEPS